MFYERFAEHADELEAIACKIRAAAARCPYHPKGQDCEHCKRLLLSFSAFRFLGEKVTKDGQALPAPVYVEADDGK